MAATVTVLERAAKLRIMSIKKTRTKVGVFDLMGNID